MKPSDLLAITQLQPTRPAQPVKGPARPAPGAAGQHEGFSKVLADKRQASAPDGKNTLVFSAHAQHRLRERNIALSAHNLQRLDHGVQLAESKGSVNSLVLMDDMAFIISVKNKTVITAIPRHEGEANVFTQIDSATIV